MHLYTARHAGIAARKTESNIPGVGTPGAALDLGAVRSKETVSR